MRLQIALDYTESLASMWQLTTSIDKCCVLNTGSVALSPSLSLNSTILPIVPFICDLRVTINSRLSPAAHVANIVAKAHKSALVIHRSCFR